MFWIGPRPFLIGEANIPLDYAKQYWMRSIPNGGFWTLHYILVSYDLNVEGQNQTGAEPSYRLFDADGRAYQINPVQLSQVTSPGANKGLNGTNFIGVRYPGGSSVKLEISGQAPGGGGPDSISITLAGIRSWELLGG